MKKKLKLLLFLIAVSFIYACGVTPSLKAANISTYISHPNNNKTYTSDPYHYLKLFSDIVAMVQDNYIKKTDQKTLMYGAINGMLNALSQDSSFLTPAEYKEIQVESKTGFSCVGINMTIRDDTVTVIAPIEGGPADRAGIEANDQIIKINDEPTLGMSLMDAILKMRGPKGSKVKLTILREGLSKPLEIELVRGTIANKTVKSMTLKPGFGYIRISSFESGTAIDLQKAIEKLQAENSGGIKGLILDLRNNPGGMLDQAIEASDQFLNGGLIGYTDARIAAQKMRFVAHKKKHPLTFSMVVLVNGGSAGASEIVAGALQDHKRAVIMGETTFGRGSLQTTIPLSDGSALRLTTSEWYTPSGRSFEYKGIQPDVFVRDSRTTSGIGNKGEKTAGKLGENDIQLKRALDLLESNSGIN